MKEVKPDIYYEQMGGDFSVAHTPPITGCLFIQTPKSIEIIHLGKGINCIAKPGHEALVYGRVDTRHGYQPATLSRALVTLGGICSRCLTTGCVMKKTNMGIERFAVRGILTRFPGGQSPLEVDLS